MGTEGEKGQKSENWHGQQCQGQVGDTQRRLGRTAQRCKGVNEVHWGHKESQIKVNPNKGL